MIKSASSTNIKVTTIFIADTNLVFKMERRLKEILSILRELNKISRFACRVDIVKLYIHTYCIYNKQYKS